LIDRNLLSQCFYWGAGPARFDGVQEIAELAEKGLAAKADKDWASADAICDQLSELGWEIEDGKEGYEVVPK
jgi:cysteinyl-tRNA synthetase